MKNILKAATSEQAARRQADTLRARSVECSERFVAGCCSLFREELKRAVGGGDLTHGVAASLREASRRRRLVVDIDAVVWPLDGRRAGGRAEETCKAGGQRERERKFSFSK